MKAVELKSGCKYLANSGLAYYCTRANGTAATLVSEHGTIYDVTKTKADTDGKLTWEAATVAGTCRDWEYSVTKQRAEAAELTNAYTSGPFYA